MAIKSFNTLIKLHKRRVDIIRREMLALEEQRTQLLQLSRTLQAEYAHEVGIASSDAHIAGFFGAYAQRVQKKLEAIANEVLQLDAAIEAKGEAIRTEFAEQKKYEIAKAAEMKRLAEKEHTRQQARFDEIGAQQYMKQQELLVKENVV